MTFGPEEMVHAARLAAPDAGAHGCRADDGPCEVCSLRFYLSRALDALEEARRMTGAVSGQYTEQVDKNIIQSGTMASLSAQLSEVREERDRMRSEGVRDDPALAALRKENEDLGVQLARALDDANIVLFKRTNKAAMDVVYGLEAQLSASQAREEELREALVRADKALQWCHDEHRSDGDQSLADLGDDIASVLASPQPSETRQKTYSGSAHECLDEVRGNATDRELRDRLYVVQGFLRLGHPSKTPAKPAEVGLKKCASCGGRLYFESYPGSDRDLITCTDCAPSGTERNQP